MEKRVHGTLQGTIVPPPSKSQAHRLLICAALSTEPCSIVCSSVNDDIIATMRCLNALGAKITFSSGVFDVNPIEVVKGGILDCGESGSTLRFLMSVAAVLGADATFTGAGKLPQRPMGALTDVLSAHGVCFECHSDDELPVTCKGVLQGGKFSLPGNVSSQYLTGLLFALPLAAVDSEIEVTGDLTSASYIDMTIDALRVAGIQIERKDNIFRIKGNQHYRMPRRVVVEGDWSSAAFWVVAGVIGKHPLTICGMNNESLQGDSAIIDHLRSMGAFISVADDRVVAMPSHLFGAELDCMDTPDLVPILSVAAAVAQGATIFTNVGRLRFKESDRLAAMKSVLSSFGISSVVGEDIFTVYGGEPSPVAPIDSFGDHRIAMSATVLSTFSNGIAIIKDAGCVAKSYPSFFEDFAALGGVVG
ncbi:MAG: 3-phosphoshikimate 1-carboxyvinyltransferase [Bacteroidaceae bacterium]|nr:3-phosphoshikimate 1-carboxyvinyltransferase [Bacteroidaceae bacterium]